MNSLTLILVMILAILVLVFVLSLTVNKCTKLKRELKKLEEKNSQLHRNIAFLVEHINKVQELQKDKENVINKIEGAKNDEELNEIISGIIDINNNRVQNNKG